MSDILQIKAPTVPSFRFEWHTGNKRVYVIRVGTKPEIGDPIAYEIENHGAAINAVLIYLRGYHAHKAETSLIKAA